MPALAIGSGSGLNLRAEKHILLLFWALPYIMYWKLDPANYKTGVIFMDKEKTVAAAAEPAAKKKGGRKPMTPEEKAAAAKARTESKAKADSLKPAVIVQFQGSEVELDTLVEAVKADFRQAKKRTPITDLKLYVKPEERMAYYVVNEKFNGSVSY